MDDLNYPAFNIDRFIDAIISAVDNMKKSGSGIFFYRSFCCYYLLAPSRSPLFPIGSVFQDNGKILTLSYKQGKFKCTTVEHLLLKLPFRKL